MNAHTFTQKSLANVQAAAALAGAVLRHIEADDGKPLLVLTRDAFTAQVNSVEQVHLVLADLTTGEEASHDL